MPRIAIERAFNTHDAELKQLLRENTPKGSIRVRYEREPNFVGGSVVEGTTLNISFAKNLDNNQLMGMAVRATKASFIRQEKQLMGYLSSFRIKKEARGSFTFIKFFRGLKEVHAQSDCKWDIMMLTDGNDEGEQLILSGRAGLPKAYFLGDFYTLSLGLRRQYPTNTSQDILIRKLTEGEWDQWFDFLSSTGPKQRELYPFYQKDHLNPDEGLLKGIKADDVYVAWEGGKMVGTLTRWDQNAFKQYYIDGYSPTIKTLRPAVNAYARFSGKPLLPKSGQQMKMIFLGTVCIENDQREIFDLLLKRVMLDLQQTGNYHSLMAGFHERDPLLKVARIYPHVAYKSKAWMLSWEDVSELVDHLQRSKLYLELGAL